jgi:hypothetical protein
VWEEVIFLVLLSLTLSSVLHLFEPRKSKRKKNEKDGGSVRVKAVLFAALALGL